MKNVWLIGSGILNGALIVIVILAASKLNDSNNHLVTSLNKQQQIISDLHQSKGQLAGVEAGNKQLSDKIASLEQSTARYKQEKADYEARLAEMQTRLQAAAKPTELIGIGGPVKTALVEPAAKSKKKGLFVQVVKSQITKQYKNRITKLKEQATLSPYQEEEINKLVDAEVQKAAEFAEAIFSGDPSVSEAAAQRAQEGDNYDQKLKEILSPEQYLVYQELLEQERKEQVKQTVKLYLEGTIGMKGMTETIGLSTEQKQKVQDLFESQMNEYMKGYNPDAPYMQKQISPFRDSVLVQQIRDTLTPEQYPKLEIYLKEMEELMKMAEQFVPKGE